MGSSIKTDSGVKGVAELTVPCILSSPVWNSVSEQSLMSLQENHNSPPPSFELMAAIETGLQSMQSNMIATNLRMNCCQQK
jgi:hypothetical protein